MGNLKTVDKYTKITNNVDGDIIKAHDHIIQNIIIEKDLIYTCSYDKTVKIWNKVDKALVKTIYYDQPVLGLGLTLDKNSLISITKNSIHIMDNFGITKETIDFDEIITCMFLTDIIYVGFNNKIQIYDLYGELLSEFKTSSPVKCIAGDIKNIYYSTNLGVFKIGYNKPLLSTYPDSMYLYGKTLFTLNMSKNYIQWWNMDTLKKISTYTNVDDNIDCFYIDEKDDILYVGTNKDIVCVYINTSKEFNIIGKLSAMNTSCISIDKDSENIYFGDININIINI